MHHFTEFVVHHAMIEHVEQAWDVQLHRAGQAVLALGAWDGAVGRYVTICALSFSYDCHSFCEVG